MASGWIVQILLAVLVLSFAVWGVADIFTGFGQNAVARVGSADITVREFQRRYQVASQNVLQQIGQNLTPQQLAQFGLPQQVLNELVIEAAFNDAAGRMGLGLSNAELGRQIASDPAFRAPTGQFDRQYLSQIISAQQMTESEFILDRRDAYTRAQLIQAFGSGSVTPEAYMKAVHEYRDVQRNVSYVMVLAPTPEEVGNPSDDDLNAFFNAHQAAWRAPEYRSVNFFVLSPSEIANPDQVTDDDALARYKAQPDLYRVPAQRQVEQIVFKDKADAEAAQMELAGGKSFEDVAMTRGLQPADYDLGFITKNKIVDKAVADTAFSIAENSVSAVIDGQFGPVIVKVKGVQEEIVIAFDDAKADIKQQIALERASADILSIRDAIEDARAGGTNLADAAAKFDIKMNNVMAMDQAGLDPEGNQIPGLPVAVLMGAFSSNVGQQNDPVEPDKSSFAWYEVTKITPPRDRPLAEVHDKVVAAWKDEQRQKTLEAKTAEIKKRLDAGETLAQVAADNMLMVEKLDMVTRLTQPAGAISAATLNTIFATEKGKSAIAPAAVTLTSIVFTVDDVIDPPYVADDATLKQVKDQLNSQIVTDLLSTYAGQLQKQTEVRFNQAAIAAAVGITPTQ